MTYDSDTDNQTRPFRYEFPTSIPLAAISALSVSVILSSNEKIRIMSIGGIVIVAGLSVIGYIIGTLISSAGYYKSVRTNRRQTE